MKKILSSIIVFLVVLTLTPEKMKKVRIDISPSIGSPSEIYVDIRFDKEHYEIYKDDAIIECALQNCIKAQEQLAGIEPAVPRRWRASNQILDRVHNYYSALQNKQT